MFDALGELTVQRDLRPVQNPVKYVEGILKTWQREGKRITNMIEHLQKLSR